MTTHGVTRPRRATGAQAVSRTARGAATETRPAFKTTELAAYIVATVGVLIAGLVTKAGGGHDDRLTADQAWLFVTILTVGYMLSRGLAKSGSYETGFDDPRRDDHVD
jgi:hypothetical protein